MPRYKLIIEYDGTDYVGWQRQDNGVGIQQCVEMAINDFCGETVTVFASGRTDAGVHALEQVAHFDLAKETEPDVIRDALNHHLKPAPIAVLSAHAAPDDFHSRFSALERQYVYRIVNRRAPPTVDRGRVWWVPTPLDAPAMHHAASVLIGRHDFTSFRAAMCQAKSPIKTLDDLEVLRDGDEIRVYARARSFLHHMVRNIVGTLKLVGEDKWSTDDVRRALVAHDRSAAGPTAPAGGLYLSKVIY
ncbi:MAG: tRNA pseudouridine(38-40) synthase TruA [Rhodospirillales bacterium]|jgi:tRNA pseudouridine38-40 synthase|nr:tRNA pseudouridine(38-40) synthase TruA [Rhodospirillales bacterium]